MSRPSHPSGASDWNLDDQTILAAHSTGPQPEGMIPDSIYCEQDNRQDDCGLPMDSNLQHSLDDTFSLQSPGVLQVPRAYGIGSIGEGLSLGYQLPQPQTSDRIINSVERDASIEQQQRQQQSPASSTSTSSRPMPQLTFSEAGGQPEEEQELAETTSEAEEDTVGEISLTTMERLAGKRKMKRFRLTHSQTRFLMSEFSRQAHPDSAHRERLSCDIPGLSSRQVQVWFQNRRAKLKRLTSDDQDRMIRSRALPADFDLSRTLQPTFGERRQSSSSFNQMPDPNLFGGGEQRRPQNTPLGPSDGRYVPPLSMAPVSGHSATNPGLAAGSVTISPVSSVYDGSAYSESPSPATPHRQSSSPFAWTGNFPPNSNVHRPSPGLEGQGFLTRARKGSLAGLTPSTTCHGFGNNSVISEPDTVVRPRAASFAHPSSIATSFHGQGNQNNEKNYYQQQIFKDSAPRRPSLPQGLGGMASLQVSSPLSSANPYPENQQVLMRHSTAVTTGYSTVPNQFDINTGDWASRQLQPNSAPQDLSFGYYDRPAFYRPQVPPMESPIFIQPAGPGYQPFITSSTINTSFNVQTTTPPDGQESRPGAPYPGYFGRV